jgi:ribosome recycling factor
MDTELLSHTKSRMKKAVDHFAEETKTLRTGRANASLVEGVEAMYYGVKTPLKQMANVLITDAHSIAIQPWDPKALGDIEQAIREAGLGLNPTNDGKSVRINLPPLTQERRAELVKLLHKMGEEARVVLRGIRKDVWDEVQKNKKDGLMTEDDMYKAEEQLNKAIDEFNTEIEAVVKEKETDILTV